ncbi:MAG: hypothetical protein Q9190_006501 [Brigantiaea leucoxantha]
MSIPSPPRIHVTVYLPEEISFSSAEEPQLEVRMTLDYAHPIIIVRRRSRLWPLHPYSALTLHNIESGKPEYLPRVDVKLYRPTIPPLNAEHREEFVGLSPGQTSTMTVSFRPYDQPYDYERMKDNIVERYKMCFPIGMQFLKVGGVYEFGIQGGCKENYMLGDLDDIIENRKSAEWAAAHDLAEFVPGEKCHFRVTS